MSLFTSLGARSAMLVDGGPTLLFYPRRSTMFWILSFAFIGFPLSRRWRNTGEGGPERGRYAYSSIQQYTAVYWRLRILFIQQHIIITRNRRQGGDTASTAQAFEHYRGNASNVFSRDPSTWASLAS